MQSKKPMGSMMIVLIYKHSDKKKCNNKLVSTPNIPAHTLVYLDTTFSTRIIYKARQNLLHEK